MAAREKPVYVLFVKQYCFGLLFELVVVTIKVGL